MSTAKGVLHISASILLLALAAQSQSLAETAAQKGYRIAKLAAEREEGYRDQKGAGKMTLRNRAGQKSVRDFAFKSLETPSGDKTLLVFNWPGNIRDTGLLTYSHASRNDDQWLYLPAVRRVKRISSTGRSGSFVGSEFAYEDMVNQQLEKYTYKWISTQACPTNKALKCEVIDRFPKFNSGYRKQRNWLDTKHYRLHQTMYFDRRGAHVKTMQVSNHKLFKGRFWRGMLLNMRNLRTGKTTQLAWRDMVYGAGLRANDFTRRALEKQR